MFLASTLGYPCVLVVLCLGAGLLTDRLSGGFLPYALLPIVGASALIAFSQLSTYLSWLAPVSPYLMASFALAGFLLARVKLLALLRAVGERPWLIALPLIAYLLALAPVLLAGRASFSSYMTLADSAVHMIGADYLIHHGQQFSHLDLRNSYGQFIKGYYAAGYPSGADTLFGASALLLRLPLIWAFQPFNAFMLALATGPAWLLARRLGLTGMFAVLAALAATLGALVYAYELFASVKEISVLGMILALGCLVTEHHRWLCARATGGLAIAVLFAGGLAALGTAFGVWALVATIVLAGVLIGQLRARRLDVRGVVALLGVGVVTLVIAAGPTWINLSGALQVTQTIATTANPGNLHSPLRAIQIFGVWLNGSYKLAPTGVALLCTYLLIALAVIAAVLGALHVLRTRRYVFAGWLALMLIAWLLVSNSVTTWGAAKTLMLTSPVVILLAFCGVGSLRTRPASRIAALAGTLLALTLTGGVLASDAMQYHVSDLAPTARYEELAKLDSRFAGQGPTLFTDFDEYAMYELRDLDVGGPDFASPPATLAAAAGGYGQPVDIDRIAPSALRAYPLIITRRDPAASRPPAAYRLVWQGSYYQVWRRIHRAKAALSHYVLHGTRAAQCTSIGRLASAAPTGARLAAAVAPQLVGIPLKHTVHPAHWGHERKGLVMGSPGRLSATFRVPFAGRWEVWIQGQLMPTVKLSLDGRTLASISDQLSGNSLVPNTVPAVPVTLSVGAHRISLTRPGFSFAPGAGGHAVLDTISLTPVVSGQREGALLDVAASRWRLLCARRYQWVEVL
ncbi:MAG: hypothetical protein ACRDK2_00145 [Solirubrobacteraceae bacterium]